MKVFLNDSKDPKQPRRIAEVDLIKEYPKSILVRLSDGNIIKRKKNRDIPLKESK